MIIVSACLLGENCKYSGHNNFSPSVSEYLKDKDYMAICPETAGGLSVPRDPCEITCGEVFTSSGKNVTAEFHKGAKIILDIALSKNADLAILKQGSPSCGCGKIYDGTFTGKKITGNGITADLLLKNGIRVLTEEDFK